MKIKLIPILIISIVLTACAPGLTPVPSAYPAPATIQANSPSAPTHAPATQTNPPPTQISVPTITMTSTVQSDITAYPTPRRDWTPTPNPTSAAWSEFSSEITYANSFNGSVVGPLHFTITYPPNWYLYPGYTVIHPGEFLQGTFIQNFKRINDVPDESLSMPDTIMLIINAAPCALTEQGCPADLPLLSPGLPGTKEIRYQSSNNYTYWDAYLYAKDMQFGLHGFMLGTPEENADLIKILEDILAMVRLW